MKLIAFLCCLILNFAGSIQAAIIPFSDFSFLEDQLKAAKRGSLVVFDVNDVLMKPRSQIFQPAFKRIIIH